MAILRKRKNANNYIVTTQPKDQKVNSGQRARFIALVAGSVPIKAIQWQLSRDNGRTWKNIEHATTDNYVTPSVGPLDNNTLYRANFFSVEGFVVTTNSARLLVIESFHSTRSKEGESYLVDDSSSMERRRRFIEQEGHRKLARVNAREHAEKQQITPEGELQNSIMQHPLLADQRYDGYDPNVNPEPPLNTEARREYDNEKRKQDEEKQLRLGHMPKFSSVPRPGPNR